jgi:hypothetical protein
MKIRLVQRLDCRIQSRSLDGAEVKRPTGEGELLVPIILTIRVCGKP